MLELTPCVIQPVYLNWVLIAANNGIWQGGGVKKITTDMIGRLKAVIRSKITWSVVFVVYLFGVWLSAYRIEVTSMDKWPESKRLGCPHGKEYMLLERVNRPNPWMLESTDEYVFSQELLNNPTCLGAYLKDMSTYKFPYRVIIYDEKQGVELFRIQKTQYSIISTRR